MKSCETKRRNELNVFTQTPRSPLISIVNSCKLADIWHLCLQIVLALTHVSSSDALIKQSRQNFLLNQCSLILMINCLKH